ncbi:DUF4344 domain-containing metallopeptidase [Actinocrispum wychmicini]|uniref:Putative metallopeptidase DUF4344 n=1 Tax=Actinocrispum wychmicini TaxID=1213861 RepID=A0A4V6NNU5_9PSEU|nr:DUF4344 domain-containing metallopeptidase [Actinocrispum wychmicini]TCO56020.1 putative metallopeptidase DUF4344 [Actinocrispum wychmicini]
MKLSRIIAGTVAIAAATTLAACGSDAKKPDAAPKPAAASPSATTGGSGGGGKFVVKYEEPANPALKPIEQLLKTNQVYEKGAKEMSDLVKLDQDVPVIAKECGEENAFWDPQKKEVQMCYEMALKLQTVFDADADKQTPTEQNVVGGMTAILFHEFGHGFASLFDLPITGKEDDAVDQFSAVILTMGEEPRHKMVQDVAKVWGLFAKDEKELSAAAFAGEHSLNAQRSYNFLCWMYGSAPEKFQDVVASGSLPESRAERCPSEYQKMAGSWVKLLQPHLKG